MNSIVLFMTFVLCVGVILLYISFGLDSKLTNANCQSKLLKNVPTHERDYATR